MSLASYGDAVSGGVPHGLKVVAVAVVAQAVWGMAKNRCPDVPRISMKLAKAPRRNNLCNLEVVAGCDAGGRRGGAEGAHAATQYEYC